MNHWKATTEKRDKNSMTNTIETKLHMESKNGTLVIIYLEYKETKQVVAKTSLINTTTGEPRMVYTKYVRLTRLEDKYKELLAKGQEDWVAETLQELLDNGIVPQIINNCEYYLSTQRLLVCVDGNDYVLRSARSVFKPNMVEVIIGEVPTIKEFSDSDVKELITATIDYNKHNTKEDIFETLKDVVLDGILTGYDITEETTLKLLSVLRNMIHDSYKIRDLWYNIRDGYNELESLDINWNDNENSKVVKETEESIRGINLLMDYLINGSSSKVDKVILVHEDGTEEDI